MTTVSQDPSPTTPDHPGHGTLNVTVRYAAAPKPFQDHNASRDETLQSLKKRVLTEFGLTEGEGTPEGNVLTYKLYHDKEELTDLSRKLGEVARNAHALALKLSQFIQQGKPVEA